MPEADLPPADTAQKTADVTRGAERLLQSLDYATLMEFSLGNGRRVDIAAIERKGALTFVEVKTSVSDFKNDRKWPEYLDYCDALYFAVAVDFPLNLLDLESALPERTGIIVADRYGGSILRTASVTKMNAARRRAETLRFARRAAGRLSHAVAAPNQARHWPKTPAI